MTAWRARLRPHRPLMLRTRFTLAAAGAVAAVTLAVTAVAFLVLRSDLQDQVQQQLRQQSDVVHRVAGHYPGRYRTDRSRRTRTGSGYPARTRRS